MYIRVDWIAPLDRSILQTEFLTEPTIHSATRCYGHTTRRESRLRLQRFAPGAGSLPHPAIGIVSEGVTHLLTRGRSIVTRGDERFLSGRGGAHPWHTGILSVVGEIDRRAGAFGGHAHRSEPLRSELK